MRTIEDDIYGGEAVYFAAEELADEIPDGADYAGRRIGAPGRDNASLFAAALIGFMAGSKASPPAPPSAQPAPSVPTVDADHAAALMRQELGALHKPPMPVSKPARPSLADRMSEMCRRNALGARHKPLPAERAPSRPTLADRMSELCKRSGIGAHCATPRSAR